VQNIIGYEGFLAILEGSKPAWDELLSFIEQHYDMEILWHEGKPNSENRRYELKYRRGSKTLIALYMRKGYFITIIVLGKVEREKFEAHLDDFSQEFIGIYEKTESYHDGKWLIVDIYDNTLIPDMIKLLQIKRKPNRKA